MVVGMDGGTVHAVDIIERVPGGVQITVWVVPGANRSEVKGIHDGALRIRVAAPASGGKANSGLVAVLERLTGGKATIVQGFGSRRKVVSIQGVSVAEVRRVLYGRDAKRP